jgi:hypothetical protein
MYDALEQQAGAVSTFNKILAHKPDALCAFNQLYSAAWAEGALSPKLKELRVTSTGACAPSRDERPAARV